MGTTTDIIKEAGLRAAVCALVSEAISQDVERRSLQREPFLSRVAIQLDGDDGASLTGFAREISNEGIGLLHSFPIEPSDIVITISLPGRKSFQLKVQIVWCQEFGEGWYISGGRFLARLDP